ncbi:TPA: hypothetical protein EYG96_00850 [Candidatus Gracilibacteria bacterium]|nr:hypothetical protein [Candidatus Peregrinibacteria bacterium]HIQ56573.1 hypothetical protein [Candidatus Gracilibacteria bacterium]HIQ57746.1 hypothetical protein [Candidatus Gracilibacteria bacterium]
MNDNTFEEEEEEYDIGKVLYEFTSPEFEKKERGSSWFILLGACVIAGVIIGIFTDSLSVILLAVMIGFVYTVTHNKKPNEIHVLFTDIGMQWKEKFFSYQEIETFWIFYIPHQQKTLHIILKNGKSPRNITIQIKSQKIQKIRETLGYYIPEDEEKHEGMQNLISRKLKL